jgi:hypothetical protein
MYISGLIQTVIPTGWVRAGWVPSIPWRKRYATKLVAGGTGQFSVTRLLVVALVTQGKEQVAL